MFRFLSDSYIVKQQDIFVTLKLEAVVIICLKDQNEKIPNLEVPLRKVGVGGKTLVNCCLLVGPSRGCFVCQSDWINNQWLHWDTLWFYTVVNGHYNRQRQT